MSERKKVRNSQQHTRSFWSHNYNYILEWQKCRYNFYFRKPWTKVICWWHKRLIISDKWLTKRDILSCNKLEFSALDWYFLWPIYHPKQPSGFVCNHQTCKMCIQLENKKLWGQKSLSTIVMIVIKSHETQPLSKSERTRSQIIHSLGLGHETMVCCMSLSILMMYMVCDPHISISTAGPIKIYS